MCKLGILGLSEGRSGEVKTITTTNILPIVSLLAKQPIPICGKVLKL